MCYFAEEKNLLETVLYCRIFRSTMHSLKCRLLKLWNALQLFLRLSWWIGIEPWPLTPVGDMAPGTSSSYMMPSNYDMDIYGEAPDRMTYTEQANKRAHCKRLTWWVNIADTVYKNKLSRPTKGPTVNASPGESTHFFLAFIHQL